MQLLIITIIFWLASLVANHNWWFVIFMTVDTILVICRLQGILFKFNTMIKWEVLAIVIPAIVSLVFKRFNLVKLILVLVIRALFLLYVKYDMSQWVYPKRKIKIMDDDKESQI